MPFYAVGKGRSVGVYDSWGECEQQVKGYSGASFKKFDTPEAAQNFISGQSGGGQRSSGYSSYSSYGGGSGSTSSRGIERDSRGYAQAYTDGACTSNGQDGARAGYGVYWGDDHPLNTSKPVSGRATNNTAEIQAANQAMKQALHNGIDKLTVNTDSQFVIDSATKWIPVWKDNGWKTASGEPVVNQQDFKQLDRLQSQLNVEWKHVDAHAGNHGNEMADRLARDGASKYN